MKTRKDRLIILHQCLTRRQLAKVYEKDPHLKDIFSYTADDIHACFAIPQQAASKIVQGIHYFRPQFPFPWMNSPIKMITIFDELYPDALRYIPDPPFVLYAIGDVSLLKKDKMISVIGTRKPSYEASQKLDHLVQPLIQDGWIIVSGLAYGIDSMAHRLTIDEKGKTIAILGGGFHHIYPKENIPLCREIAKTGLILSEYAPNIRPRKYHFPERNRLISGVSQATLVIEAKERSGTLITVEQALEQGKEVYAVPGAPYLLETKGCHQLIQDGAKLVMDVSDILEDWPKASK